MLSVDFADNVAQRGLTVNESNGFKNNFCSDSALAKQVKERETSKSKEKEEKSISRSVAKCLPLKWKAQGNTEHFLPSMNFHFHAPHPLIDFLHGGNISRHLH